MNRYFVFTLMIVQLLLLSSCSNKTTLSEKITLQETELFSMNASDFDTTLARSLINDYTIYSKKFPSDSLSLTYLFTGANLYIGLGEPKNALTLLDQAINLPSKIGDRHADALFLKGFILENHIGALAKAKEIYEQFLQIHPDHPFAYDVSISLQHLGKTPEELVEKFSEEVQEGRQK